MPASNTLPGYGEFISILETVLNAHSGVEGDKMIGQCLAELKEMCDDK